MEIWNFVSPKSGNPEETVFLFIISVKLTVVFTRIVGKHDVDSKISMWEFVRMYVYIFVSSSILPE